MVWIVTIIAIVVLTALSLIAGWWGPSYRLPAMMLLAAIWLVILPFNASSDVLYMMAADACGQILDPDLAMTAATLMKVLHYALVIAVLAEFIRPNAVYSAWVFVTIPIIGFLVTVSGIALAYSDFLTQCDIFVFSPITTVKINLLSVLIMALLGFARHRLWGRRDRALIDCKCCEPLHKIDN